MPPTDLTMTVSEVVSGQTVPERSQVPQSTQTALSAPSESFVFVQARV